MSRQLLHNRCGAAGLVMLGSCALLVLRSPDIMGLSHRAQAQHFLRLQERSAARPAHTLHEHHVERGSSALHLADQLRRSHGASDRGHHPQHYRALPRLSASGVGGADGSEPAPVAAVGAEGEHRRAQATAAGAAGPEVLTVGSTTPIKIILDPSSLYECNSTNAPLCSACDAAAPGKPLQTGCAQPYSTCFRVGDWFRWNFPATATPPCAQPKLPAGFSSGQPVRQNSAGESVDPRTWEGFAHAQRLMEVGSDVSAMSVCGEVDGRASLYSPSNKAGVICNRNYPPEGQNCWGVCVAEDVIDDANRPWMLQHLRSSVDEASELFRLRPRTANLKLSSTIGLFYGIYARYGVSTSAECAKDARRMYRLPVPDAACGTGVDADAVLYAVMPQYVPGVAGWGSDAGKDQYGRPVVLVMGWSVPSAGGLTGLAPRGFRGQNAAGTLTFEEAAQDRRNRYDARGIVLHEIVHTLGFSVWTFQNVREEGSTENKRVVELKTKTDVDGAVDAGVWHVVSERTVEVARQYFNCSSLTAVPLMGENQLGDGSRGSHWETRIMNDEFMAYGEGSMVSDMTLALMEDLGLYLGNYSNAQCMFWGRQQGCAFVSSRCGVRRDDSSLPAAAAVPAPMGGWPGTVSALPSGAGVSLDCDRTYPKTFGGTVNGRTYSGSAFMKRKCAVLDCVGKLPLRTTAQWVGLNGQVEPTMAQCNAECFRPSTESSVNSEVLKQFKCGSIPPGSIRAAAGDLSNSWAGGASKRLEENPIFFACLFAGFCLLVMILFCSCCRMKHYHPLRVLFLFINTCTVLCGAAMLTAGILAYAADDFYVDFYGIEAVRNGIILAGIVTCWGLFGYVALYAVRRECFSVLFFYILILLLVICFQTACAIIVVVWVYDSYSIENGNYLSVGQHGAPVVTGIEDIDKVVAESLQQLEQVACNTYRTCCWDLQQTILNRTRCMDTHGGAGVGAAASQVQDPSRDDFCELITGIDADSTQGRLGRTKGACVPFEEAKIVNLQECGKDFCDSGKKGFERFVGNTFTYIRDNLVWFCLFMAVFGVGESMLFCCCVALFVLHARGIPDHIYRPAKIELRHKTHFSKKKLSVLNVEPEVAEPAFAEEQGAMYGGSPDDEPNVLAWAQDAVSAYERVPPVKSFGESFKNGMALAAIVDKYRPNLLDYHKMRPDRAIENLRFIFSVIHRSLRVPADAIPNPEHIVRGATDKSSPEEAHAELADQVYKLVTAMRHVLVKSVARGGEKAPPAMPAPSGTRLTQGSARP